jgi:hypothetical protein
MTARDLDPIAIGLEQVLTEDAPNSLNSFKERKISVDA